MVINFSVQFLYQIFTVLCTKIFCFKNHFLHHVFHWLHIDLDYVYNKALLAVFKKSGGLPDKTGKFSIFLAKTFSLSDKCPVNLSKEHNILTSKLPMVLQILTLSCKRFQSANSCPASVEMISQRLSWGYSWWVVLGLTAHLRQYFSLYQSVSLREGE